MLTEKDYCDLELTTMLQFEEALSDGIKEAVKILKEGNK